MSADQEDIQLKVDVGVLKSQVSNIILLCDKMDKVIERITESQEKIVEQVYTDMRKREEEKDADVKELHSRITTISRELSDKVELTERRIMDKIDKLHETINDHNAKEDSDLKKIMEWKWMAAGGIIVLAWLFSHINLDMIGKLFG